MKYGWTKVGPCRIEKEDEGRALVRLPGRKRGQWVSKTQLLPVPELFRMIMKAEFDQKCGCTAVVDINGTKVESYNIYGSLKKYTTSGVKAAIEATPHHRRKFLKENGFVRAGGNKPRTVSEPAQYAYEKATDGYKLVTA